MAPTRSSPRSRPIGARSGSTISSSSRGHDQSPLQKHRMLLAAAGASVQGNPSTICGQLHGPGFYPLQLACNRMYYLPKDLKLKESAPPDVKKEVMSLNGYIYVFSTGTGCYVRNKGDTSIVVNEHIVTRDMNRRIFYMDGTPYQPRLQDGKGKDVVHYRLELQKCPLWKPRAHDIFSIKYSRVGKILGKGAFGTVFMAQLRHDKANHTIYAVKSIKPDPDKFTAAHIAREVKIMRDMEDHVGFALTTRGGIELMRCGQPNIVKLYESITVKEKTYLVMEYVSGGNLRSYITDGVDALKIQDWMRQIFTGVSFLHGQNIAHRDLKPENILISAAGIIKIADFGLSKEIRGQNVLLSVLGTAAYMAPEIHHNQSMPSHQRVPCNLNADVWSLGVIMSEMCFSDKAWTEFHKHTSTVRRNITLPDCRGRLSSLGLQVLRYCLQDNPQLRWTSAMILQHQWLRPVPLHAEVPAPTQVDRTANLATGNRTVCEAAPKNLCAHATVRHGVGDLSEMHASDFGGLNGVGKEQNALGIPNGHDVAIRFPAHFYPRPEALMMR